MENLSPGMLTPTSPPRVSTLPVLVLFDIYVVDCLQKHMDAPGSTEDEVTILNAINNDHTNHSPYTKIVFMQKLHLYSICP